MDLSKRPISELFPLIQIGDTRAFDQLFLRYYPRLVVFARQYVRQQEAAEEVASEVFVKLWLKRGKLGQVDRPEVYLYVAIKNTALNYLRSVKNQPATVTDEPFTIELADFPEADGKELNRVLQEAIATLTEQRRVIFRMIKEDGLKVGDVAAILEISPRTVENQLYKAVKFLADHLSSYLGYHPQQSARRNKLLINLFMGLISVLVIGCVL